MALFRLELQNMMFGLALPLLVLLAIVIVVVIAVQRSMKKSEQKSGGADIISYLVLALAIGVTGFALVELARTAFPGDRFIFDPADNVATSLAALVVAGPFAFYFWRRQAQRRIAYPASPGWTLYLALIELVFMSALVVSAVAVIDGLFGGGEGGAWVATVVFGAIVVFHEVAARRTPPQSDSAELARVIGSAIGLITLMVGLAGTLAALFSLPFDLIDVEFGPWVAILIVGTAVWLYRWFRPWDAEPGLPRTLWSVVVSIGSLAAVVGSATTIGVMILLYLFTDTPPAGDHFDTVPVALGILITTLATWGVHRRDLGPERSNALRTYEYALAGLGLTAAVVGAIGLTVIAFDRSLIVGGGVDDVIGVAATLVVGLALWLAFARRPDRGDPGIEATAWPRRIYNLGLGIIAALVAAGALISSLFILLRRLLGESAADGGSLLIPITLFAYTGLVAWYLLAAYARDRASLETAEVVAPFEVTIICAHPGRIATRFPNGARLRVIHRGDGVGVIDDDMAGDIVAAVANHPSLVWVDADGFRVAPMLTST